jgi:group I intron endonuclease
MNIIEIYGIVNRVNGKIYIGQTKQGYLKRFKQHLCPKDKSVLLQNAIKKYGRNNFVCELLDVAYSQDLADAKEKMSLKIEAPGLEGKHINHLLLVIVLRELHSTGMENRS